MGMLKEFKEFAMKGNLVDIAVAFVMGGAFGKVVTSFTEGIVSPLIGLIGGADLSKNMLELKAAVTDASGKVTSEAVFLKWGDFVTAIINFIIVASSSLPDMAISDLLGTSEQRDTNSQTLPLQERN